MDSLYKIEKQKTKTLLLSLIFASLILFIVASLTIDYEQRQGLSINAMAFGRYPVLFLASGIIGTIFIFSLSQLLSTLKSKAILLISNGTIIILAFHELVINLFAGVIVTYNPLLAVLFSWSVLIICCFLILLINRYFPILLGNRKVI